MEETPARPAQLEQALAALRRVLAGALRAVYLHGSAVLEGLRPQSDLDLLVVVDRPMTEGERRSLLSDLLRISGRHPATPGGPRCVEIMIFVASALANESPPALAEFTYGEWLRPAFERGLLPMPSRDPEHVLLLAQARQEARPLVGPQASELLPEVSREAISQAMKEVLPALMGGLRGDERNVLLSLARIWRTAATGEFVSKNAAAAWAMPKMPEPHARTLDLAHCAYLGDVGDDWTSRQASAAGAAGYLRERVRALLETE
ncbi:aminoglycoside adenylyltransferase family protein [Geminicoccus roseus]|uniref:aminoglycoside adenylyltransferase family protein n=1 Tax=Geminicoccus roseus TaxID=404900 RepID=UPI0004188DE9|nr:aminoglycoside adenylyltransferase family protein [Geminicoccus roseus]